MFTVQRFRRYPQPCLGYQPPPQRNCPPSESVLFSSFCARNTVWDTNLLAKPIRKAETGIRTYQRSPHALIPTAFHLCGPFSNLPRIPDRRRRHPGGDAGGGPPVRRQHGHHVHGGRRAPPPPPPAGLVGRPFLSTHVSGRALFQTMIQHCFPLCSTLHWVGGR